MSSLTREYAIYAVDFDDTLCKSVLPGTGEVNEKLADFIRERHVNGDKIILWTCRCGKLLDDAVQWCKDNNIPIDAVNDNIPEIIEKWEGVNCRKIYADYYIDDKMFFSDLFPVPFSV